MKLKTKIDKNQKGFSVVEVVLLSLILIVLVFLTFYVVRQNQTASRKYQDQTTASSPKGIEAMTAKGLEEELKIEDQQATKEASSASDEIKASGDLEGAYEAGF